MSTEARQRGLRVSLVSTELQLTAAVGCHRVQIRRRPNLGSAYAMQLTRSSPSAVSAHTSCDSWAPGGQLPVAAAAHVCQCGSLSDDLMSSARAVSVRVRGGHAAQSTSARQPSRDRVAKPSFAQAERFLEPGTARNDGAYISSGPQLFDATRKVEPQLRLARVWNGATCRICGSSR